MIIALMFLAVLQDGPIRTVPELPLQESVTPGAGPGPVCSVDGRPVTAPGCPVPETAGGDRPAGRLDRDFSAADRPAPTTPGDICEVTTTGRSSQEGFDCARRQARAQEAAGAGRQGFRTARRTDGEVPSWALTDPERWEASQCGTDGEDTCRRQARNRLAMARAGVAAEDSASGAAPTDNCRMVMRRSENGFGGSLSRVCGDEAAVESALDRLESAIQPATQPCDRPASLESQEAWIARCRALPPR